MFGFLFPGMVISSQYVDPLDDPEFNHLTNQEKEYMRFVDKCLFKENERVNNAAGYAQLLIGELSVDPDKYEPEYVHEKMEEIKKGLTDEEKVMIDKFFLAYINVIGIYSPEAKAERRQDGQMQMKLEMKGMKENE